MNKKTVKYTDEPLGEVKIIRDFLPKPEELVMKEKTIKVTLVLSKSTVDFFKKKAKKHHAQYQKMIRLLLDQYTEHYKQDKSA